jgi:rubrerythrin
VKRIIHRLAFKIKRNNSELSITVVRGPRENKFLEEDFMGKQNYTCDVCGNNSFLVDDANGDFDTQMKKAGFIEDCNDVIKCPACRSSVTETCRHCKEELKFNSKPDNDGYYPSFQSDFRLAAVTNGWKDLGGDVWVCSTCAKNHEGQVRV